MTPMKKSTYRRRLRFGRGKRGLSFEAAKIALLGCPSPFAILRGGKVPEKGIPAGLTGYFVEDERRNIDSGLIAPVWACIRARLFSGQSRTA